MTTFRPLSALLVGTLFAGTPALSASFDCSTARATDEKAICNSCDLAQLDVKMDTLYGVISRLSAMGARGDLRDTQRAWLARRSLCGSDASCLRDAYQGRIGELEQTMNAIYSRGPF